MSKLISEGYRRLNADLHDTSPLYGVSINDTYTKQRLRMVGDVIREADAHSALDYGCGKGELAAAAELQFPDTHFWRYDPAIEMFASDPPQCDVVFSFSVLEHVEPEYVANVIDHIHSKTGKAALILVETIPAKKTLSDGRNAHLTVEPINWWAKQFSRRFKIVLENSNNESYGALLRPLP